MFHYLEDVIAVFGFDDVAELAGLERECRFVESRGVSVASEQAEVATANFGAGIIGIFSGEPLKVSAASELVEKFCRAIAPLRHLGRHSLLEVRFAEPLVRL